MANVAGVIVRVAALEVAPPGFCTVMATAPGVVSRLAGTDTAIVCAVAGCAGCSVVVFHRTMEPGTKFVPVTVRLKAWPPAVAEAGFRLVIAGALTANCALAAAPPGFDTATLKVPARVKRLAGTAATICVPLAEVTVSGTGFAPATTHCTVAPERKFVPLIVRVRPCVPAGAELGTRLETAGPIIVKSAGCVRPRPGPSRQRLRCLEQPPDWPVL